MDIATGSFAKARILSPSRMATLSLVIVGVALAANVQFNFVMAVLDKGYPYTYFMFMPEDRWADFFKMIFTYPGGEVHPPYARWVFQDHIDALAAWAYEHQGGFLNPDHMPPLPTLMAVLGRKAFTMVDPVVLFFALFSLGALALGWTVRGFMAETGAKWRWTAFALLSYPFLFTLDRGHMFALICGLTLMAATWRVIQSGRIDWQSILLLVIAMNLRPNVAIIPGLLVLCQRAGRFRDLVMLGIAAAVALVAAMAAAQALYPYYGWETWFKGLEEYHDSYVVMPINHGFTSSLPTVLELMFGYGSWIPASCFALGGTIGLATIAANRWGSITTPQIIFVGLSMMSIVTPALTDYHMLPFLLPPLLIAAAGGVTDRRDLAVFLASMVVLIPKNYIYGEEYSYSLEVQVSYWSYQIFANPAVLLAATLFVVGDSLIGRRTLQPTPRL